MAEYASKGVAGSGLGLGIAGTALGLLNANGNGNGLLGGLLGGGWNNQAAQMANAAGMNALMEKDAEIAKLKAEKYSDKNDVEVYAQTRRENQDLSDRLLGNWIKPLADEAAANKVTIARIEERMNCMNKTSELQHQILEQKIDTVAERAATGIAGNSAAIAHLGKIVDSITALHIPTSVICPEVMPRWNSWEAPTNQAPATQPVVGNVAVTNK